MAPCIIPTAPDKNSTSFGPRMLSHKTIFPFTKYLFKEFLKQYLNSNIWKWIYEIFSFKTKNDKRIKKSGIRIHILIPGYGTVKSTSGVGHISTVNQWKHFIFEIKCVYWAPLSIGHSHSQKKSLYIYIYIETHTHTHSLKELRVTRSICTKGMLI